LSKKVGYANKPAAGLISVTYGANKTARKLVNLEFGKPQKP